MKYRFYTCDVFTDTRFGGNPLAVFPEANGLSDQQMQQIAREFNYSESTFVFPPEMGHTRKVRIFTPTMEIPFAGHPNIGTAFTLTTIGALGPFTSSHTVTFEEKAGLVTIAIDKKNGHIRCELTAPQQISLGKTISAEFMASVFSLKPDDIITRVHPPQVASVGLPFLIAELKDRNVLAQAAIKMERLDALISEEIVPDIHLYIRSNDDFDIRARMFAPLDNAVEDPATGSANCALVGLISHLNESEDGHFTWRIAQGVEMGRPSVLDARTEKQAGQVTSIWIGGTSVMVSEGTMEVNT